MSPQDEWKAELDSVTMLDHALAYARRGWHVVPIWWPRFALVCGCPAAEQCDRPAKHPLLTHGLKDASTSEKYIRAWWGRWPLANIGIVTGALSGVIVLDVDGTEGVDSIHALLKKHGQPPPTIGAVTGTGGRHLFWRYEDGITNRVRVAPGLDVRSDGGYIVAPPSLHACGNRYSWHEGGHPKSTRLQTLPPWLSAVMHQPPREKRRPGTFDPNKPKPKIDLDSISTIGEGGRNDALFRLASRIRWQGGDDAEVLASLRYVNSTKCQPPLKDKEVQKIAGSVVRRWAAGE